MLRIYQLIKPITAVALGDGRRASNGMEDTEIRERLEALEKKIDDVYVSAEKTRKYFLTVIVVSVVAFVLPLIGLMFAIPSFISTYSAIGGM